MGKYDELLQAVKEVLEDDYGEWSDNVFWRPPPKTVDQIRIRLRNCLDEIEPDWHEDDCSGA